MFRFADLDLRQMQHGLLVRDDVKVDCLPHSMTHEAAHVPLPGDDDQVHPCVVWRGQSQLLSVPLFHCSML